MYTNTELTVYHYSKFTQLVKRAKLEDTEPELMLAIEQNPYSAVAIKINGTMFYGFSKCSPRDTWDSFIGFAIATSRALRKGKKV